jgi:predicted ATPase
MIVSRLKLKNWRNFQRVDDIPLRQRQFVVGPNASGKSNLLDVFRFLRDIAKSEGGGLQKAVSDRGGISKIRCLAARRDPEIAIDFSLSNDPDDDQLWRYAIGLRQETRGYRQPILSFERIWRGNEQILNRPNQKDKEDVERLKHYQEANHRK